MNAFQAASARGETAVERRPLASVVREESPLGTELAADVAFDVCDALASLHVNGIVHGDLGLSRIRIAWPRGEDRSVEIFAREDENVGRPSGFYTTPARFAAPEQRKAGTMIDARADIWAIGALLRVLLAGKPRPQMLTELVESCLAEDPAARPQTIREVAERLATFASWPPACFERIAARKQADDDAKLALGRHEAKDGLGALERLEQRAIDRERESLRTPLPAPLKDEIVLDRLVSVVVDETEPAPPVIDIADDDLSVTIDDAESAPAIAIDDDYDDDFPTIAHPSSAPDVYVAAAAPPAVTLRTAPAPAVASSRTAPIPQVAPAASLLAARPASAPSLPAARASAPSLPAARASAPSLPAARASAPALPFTPRGSSPSIQVAAPASSPSIAAAPSGSWPRVPAAKAPPAATSSSPYVAPLSVSHPPSSRTAALLAPASSSAQLPAAPASDRELDTVRRRKRAQRLVPWIAGGAGAIAISAIGVLATWTYFAHRTAAATPTATATATTTATATATATAIAVTPASLPDVHITPAALPDAPIHRVAPAPIRKPAPAAADDTADDDAPAKPAAPAVKPAATDAPKAKADAPKKPASKDDEFE